jgi:molybdopterin-guanine dinucleotide biosynthesis protein A
MGTPKAALPAGAEGTFAERTAVLLRRVAAPVVEVGPGWTELPAVADDGAGPLVALVQGWSALDGPDGIESRPAGVLLVACDLPRLSEGFLRVLLARVVADGVVSPAPVIPEVGGRLQSLCAFYPASVIARAGELVGAGARAMRDLLAAVPYEVLAADQWADALADADTPADLLRLGVPTER